MTTLFLSRRALLLGTGALALPSMRFYAPQIASHPASAAMAAPASPPAMPVAATFSILADWVHNIGGDAIDLVTIVPAGGDAHTFDPSPGEMADIAQADLIFEIGIGFEPWLNAMIAAMGTNPDRIAVSDGLDLLSAYGEGMHPADDNDGIYDPHIWGDVANAIHASETVRDAMIAHDPDREHTYAANAVAYTTALGELDQAIRDRVATLPADRRKLVTTHETFGYYAAAYGFEIVGTALGSLTTEGADPSARDIAALIDRIRETGVPAIFAETTSRDRLMQTIANEAGVTLAPPLYAEGLSDADGPASTYIDMMMANTNTIVTALS